MDYVRKALDTVTGANFERQDLSNLISIKQGLSRPITQYAPQVAAKGLTHYWDEQDIVVPGNGAASYPEGARPPADAIAPVRPTNVVCRIGKTAQVTDQMSAVWTGAGSFQLAEGELERLFQEAIDFQTTLKTIEVLNEIEYMHYYGDSTNPQGYSGGQCDGLYKWVLNNGVVSTEGGSTTASTTAFTETMLKDLAQQIASGYPPEQPDTLLIPQELKEVVNGFVGGGAGRPIVQIVKDDNGGLVGGNEVSQYNTGYSVVNVRIEPYASAAINPAIGAKQVILYNSRLVAHCQLIKLSAEPLARIDTSLSRMITCTFTQEHRVPKHAGIIKNLT